MKAIIALSKSIVGILIIFTMLFSCSNSNGLSSQLNNKSIKPDASGKNINLYYTDSGKVRVNLRSQSMLDYNNSSFSFRKFPDGVTVDFFENDSTKNTVEADSAIVYNHTNLVELRHNVKITTTDSTILKTDKLFWDRSIKWLYTEDRYTLKLKNGTVNKGVGFDANQNFTNFNSRSNTGTQIIDER